MSNNSVFVDTSGFKALIDEKDEFHSRAVKIWERLKNEPVNLVTSNYILDESFTLVRSRCGIETTIEFRDILVASSSILKIVRVTVEDEAGGWGWFTKDWSKLSFTDSVSFFQMQRLKINRVFTFDDHFHRAGMQVEK